MSLQKNLQAENTSLRLERDAYRTKYGKARTDLASLQAQLDETKDEVADLKRALQHATAESTRPIDLPQSKLQVMLRLHDSDLDVYEKKNTCVRLLLRVFLRILSRSGISLLKPNLRVMMRLNILAALRLWRDLIIQQRL